MEGVVIISSSSRNAIAVVVMLEQLIEGSMVD